MSKTSVTSVRKTSKDGRKNSSQSALNNTSEPLPVFASYETERQAISRGLHDSIGQSLTAVKFILGQIKSSSEPKNAQLVDEASNLVNDSLTEIRKLLTNLRPTTIDISLQSVLESLVLRFNQFTRMKIKLDCSSLPDGVALANEATQAVVYVIREALTNAAIYFGASEAIIKAKRLDNNLVLQIENRFDGLDPADIIFLRFNVNDMHEAACLAGGNLFFESTPDNKLSITVIFPLRGK